MEMGKIMALTNYWWLLIWIFVGGILLTVIFPQRRELVCGEMEEEERWDTIPAVILVIPYIIWAGFRTDAFGDSIITDRGFMRGLMSSYI